MQFVARVISGRVAHDRSPGSRWRLGPVPAFAALVAVGLASLGTAALAREPETTRGGTRQPKPAAAAAKPAPTPDELPMTVQIVRDTTPGCEPNCLEWVSAQGRITPDTRGRFIAVLGKLGKRRPPIFIDSPGGSVDAALAIGRLIRSKGFDVVVTKSEVAPCADKDTACKKQKAAGIAQGQAKSRLAKCASSCAFVLAGGVNRLVGPASFVAVHQVATFKTLATVRRVYRVTRPLFAPPEKKLVSEQVLNSKTVRSETSNATYNKIDKFFAEMGIDPSLEKMILDTPHEKIHVLSRSELLSTRIMTASINGEDVAAEFAKAGSYDVKTMRPSAIGLAPSPGALKPPVGISVGTPKPSSGPNSVFWPSGTKPATPTAVPAPAPAAPPAALSEPAPAPTPEAAPTTAAPAAASPPAQ